MSSRREGREKSSPDVVLVGEDDDDAGVGVFTQATDDLVKLPRFGLTWDLHRLGNAETSCRDGQQVEIRRKMRKQVHMFYLKYKVWTTTLMNYYCFSTYLYMELGLKV